MELQENDTESPNVPDEPVRIFVHYFLYVPIMLLFTYAAAT